MSEKLKPEVIGRLITELSSGYRLVSNPTARRLLEAMIEESMNLQRSGNGNGGDGCPEEQEFHNLIRAIPTIYQFNLGSRIPDYFDMANNAIKTMHEYGLDVTPHIGILTRYSEITGIPYTPPKLNGRSIVQSAMQTKRADGG